MASTKGKGRGLDEFRAVHDKRFITTKKIKAGLAQLGDSYLNEREFAILCGIASQELVAHRDAFNAHVVLLNTNNSKRSQAKHCWSGTAKFAKQLRAVIAL